MDTTVIGARLPREQAAQFQQQAQRCGLTVSAALAALVANALETERRLFLGSQPPHRSSVACP